MDKTRLYTILNDCTVQLRKGDMVRENRSDGVNVVTIDAMPHADEISGVEKIDLEFLVIGVDKAKAEAHRAELISLLDAYPEPERLAGGPSYIEVGAVIGDQGTAFQLFAVGKVLGFWNIITPALFGMKGEAATTAAGRGFIMISGYNKRHTDASRAAG